MSLRSRSISAIFLLCTLTVYGSPGPKHPPASQESLDTVTRNGKALFDYDQASWKATDAMLAKKPNLAPDSKYLARKTEAGWTVVFGLLDPYGKKLLIECEATSIQGSGGFDVQAFDTPREDTGYFLRAAKALNLSLQDFANFPRSYNTAVLPAPDGGFYVYLYPAQTVDGVYPLGGDARYLVSGDGEQIKEKRLLHKTILDFDLKNHPEMTKIEAGYHTHVLTDMPEDTDVLYVLNRQPPMAEYVGTQSGVYAIQPDGTIHIEKKE